MAVLLDAPSRREFWAMMKARHVARLSARPTFGDVETKWLRYRFS
jgi:hypothetical protein